MTTDSSFPFDRIELESVFNERFASWLERNGFRRFDGAGAFSCTANSFFRQLLPTDQLR